jgi:hypothetical protein
MPSSRALWQIPRRPHAAPLDKEEPRTPSPYCFQNTNTGELRFRALISESGVDRLELARSLP